MVAFHISEAELAEDVHGALERVRQGGEVVVEQDSKPMAVIRPVGPPVRTLSEIIAAMEADGACGEVDEDFESDVEKGIAAHNLPWIPPTWD